ncbi:hypothetical protein HMPREF0860_0694 [Treponema socranskii subsp. socranskii VPI DR56BR1116 = ATCC 35536]|uniref:Uncharacterized protein n=1 Tax=Treponema socranskii subsp. socranskii VPI DR56BR1116 = ATCC 35536 TaxID=1125725 RepID=A0ABP2YQS9_TRESO|nr:hypothetical protein HMPREF0860_0694 [Treponema socranskii subsp. socranskii VPI DR56BR1116 = ATCC 35536]
MCVAPFLERFGFSLTMLKNHVQSPCRMCLCSDLTRIFTDNG